MITPGMAVVFDGHLGKVLWVKGRWALVAWAGPVWRTDEMQVSQLVPDRT